jgi:hypothetical protein
MTWTAERDDYHFDSLSTVTGGNLVIQVGGIKASLEELEAAARLIAAAPDLLAALMTVTPAPHFGEPQMQAGFYAAARAAIARATGEA